jgi:hypothetical protein
LFIIQGNSLQIGLSLGLVVQQPDAPVNAETLLRLRNAADLHRAATFEPAQAAAQDAQPRSAASVLEPGAAPRGPRRRLALGRLRQFAALHPAGMSPGAAPHFSLRGRE